MQKVGLVIVVLKSAFFPDDRDCLHNCLYGCGGGSGFFLACEDFGRMFDHSLPAFAFFVQVEISSRSLIPLFWPGSVHSGSAS